MSVSVIPEGNNVFGTNLSESTNSIINDVYAKNDMAAAFILSKIIQIIRVLFPPNAGLCLRIVFKTNEV